MQQDECVEGPQKTWNSNKMVQHGCLTVKGKIIF